MKRQMPWMMLTAACALWLPGCGESAAPPPPASQPAPKAGTAPATSAQKPPPAAATPAKPAATAAAPAATTSTPAPGTTLKDTELKEKPFIDAKTLLTLKAQSSVSVLERSGGWLRVRAQGKEGWVRLLNIKGGGVVAGSTDDLQQVAGLATGRAGTGNVVSTSGVRGLSEEELRTSKPDYAQFDQLNAYAIDAAAAQEYARKHKLAKRELAYLPEPKK